MVAEADEGHCRMDMVVFHRLVKQAEKKDTGPDDAHK